MIRNIFNLCLALVLSTGLAACSGALPEPEMPADGHAEMAFTCSHPEASRATETDFEAGDVVGLYVSEAGLPLEIAGNVANNVALTYNTGAWKPAYSLYWDNGSYDVYAHYPRIASIGSVTDQPFEVATDQRDRAVGMSGYETSDVLVASAKGIAASDAPVSLLFRHIMSKITVRLVKSDDYVGELPETAEVYVHNVYTSATLDLESGVATKNPRGEINTITARQTGPTDYSAIVVPQRVDNRVPLVEVVMNGVSFLYESRFVFKPGKHHILNLVISKNPDQLKIEIGGELSNWN